MLDVNPHHTIELNYPLIEHWRSTDERLTFLLPSYQAALRPTLVEASTPRNIAYFGDSAYIHVTKVGGLDTVYCQRALPHVDRDGFDRWFLMWVLASSGHILRSTDMEVAPEPNSNTPLKVDEEVILSAGDIIILDAYRVHWLDQDPAAQNSEVQWFAATSLDLEKRPNKPEAEALILDQVAKEITRPRIVERIR